MTNGHQNIEQNTFSDIERQLNIKIPQCLKNLLTATGFDDITLLKDMSENHILDIEAFAKTKLHACIQQKEYINYYGPLYCHNPENFEFVLGHKIILSKISEYCKVRWTEKFDKSTMTEKMTETVTEKMTETVTKIMLEDTSENIREDTNVEVPSFPSSVVNRADCCKIQGKPITVDISTESKTILKIIKHWAATKYKEVNSAVFDNMKIFCTVSESSSSNVAMTCTINCFCGTNIKITKISRSPGGSSRWIYTNYYTHFNRRHLSSLQNLVPTTLEKRNYQENSGIERFLVKLDNADRDADPERTIKEVSQESGKKNTLEESSITTLNLKDNREGNSQSYNLGYIHNSGNISAINKNHIECFSLDFSENNVNLQNVNVKNEPKVNIINSIKFKNFKPIPESVPNSVPNLCSNLSVSVVPSPALQSPTESIPISVPTETSNDTHSTDTLTILPSATNSKARNKVKVSRVYSNTKWTAVKYSRTERERRKRELSIINQPLITNFFKIVEAINSSINNMNMPIITDCINETINNCELRTTESLTKSKFFEMLVKVATINFSGKNKVNSYDEQLKKFSLYLFYSGGKLLYETLQANLKHMLPSLSTLYRFRRSLQMGQIEEGKFNFKGLSIFLEERNLPRVVWVSEDATRINGKIEYDSRTNKVLGFVLPLQNGMPDSSAYLAKNAEQIEFYFNNSSKAEYAYVVMAQPLDPQSPAFCLTIFGTDNKFTNYDVSQRWHKMIELASENNIQILGFSSDGDTRLLRAMKTELKFPCPHNSKMWYHLENDDDEQNGILCIQDQTHILTKMRTRLLNPSIQLTMGRYLVSVDHLKAIVENNTKDEHFLTKSDLSLEDKMNYNSAEKICSPKVQKLLKNDDTLATRIYLKMMNFLIDSFLRNNQSVEDRVYKMWYVVFLCRIWRQYVKRHPNLNLQTNFITLNCYTCIEINAHVLLKFIKKLQNMDNLNSNMFIPSLLSSQPCERLFRSARSITSTFSTVINFSIKDFMCRIDRISFINFVLNDLQNVFIFPRDNLRRAKEPTILNTNVNLNLDFDEIVSRAKKDAMEDCKNLGVEIENNFCNIVDIINRWQNEDDDSLKREINIENRETVSTVENQDLEPNATDNFRNFVDNDSVLETLNREDLDLKDYSYKNIDLTESSPFVKISLPKGKSKIIKKSSFCWLLFEGKGKVSVDRLRRFVTKSKFPGNLTKKASNSQKVNKNKNTIKLGGKRKNKNQFPETDIESDFSLDDSSDSEDFSDSEYCGNECIDKNEKCDVLKEHYYAVLYDEAWYIGRVVDNLNADVFKMKFLKQEVNLFIWPKVDDIANVNKKFIFYGPIQLIGTGPFQILNNDLSAINKQYKKCKNNF